MCPRSMCSSSSLIFIAVCFCTFALQLPAACAKKHRCQLCSDINVETHYGSFFRNPREKQDELSTSSPPKCSSPHARRRLQACDDDCFTLRVTSKQIGANTSEMFGESLGCSSYVLPNFALSEDLCYRREVQLITEPRYTVQANYCFCKGDYCNRRPTKHVTHASFIARAPNLRSSGTRVVADGRFLPLLSLAVLFVSIFVFVPSGEGSVQWRL